MKKDQALSMALAAEGGGGASQCHAIYAYTAYRRVCIYASQCAVHKYTRKVIADLEANANKCMAAASQPKTFQFKSARSNIHST